MYIFGKILGCGGFGKVWAAVRMEDGKQVSRCRYFRCYIFQAICRKDIFTKQFYYRLSFAACVNSSVGLTSIGLLALIANPG